MDHKSSQQFAAIIRQRITKYDSIHYIKSHQDTASQSSTINKSMQLYLSPKTGALHSSQTRISLQEEQNNSAADKEDDGKTSEKPMKLNEILKH